MELVEVQSDKGKTEQEQSIQLTLRSNLAQSSNLQRLELE